MTPMPRNYPYNCWYVAAFSHEVSRTLLGRWLLDRPVLLYRREDGTAVALENRCPHRAAPLSLGYLEGDAVRCGYHGFAYSADGRCINVPSIRGPLNAAAVRAFPVVEQPPFVWIYVGDEEQLGSVAPPPVLDWHTDPDFARVSGAMEVQANYMLLKENVLDLTHFGYVHAKSFKIVDWIDPPQFPTGSGQAGYRQLFKASPLPELYARPLGVAAGTPYDRNNYGSFVTPALQVAAVDFSPPEAEKVTARLRICHATTPIDARSMHYFWVLGRDHATAEPQMRALQGAVESGFLEDRTMIEAIQALKDRSGPGSAMDEREVSVRMDTAGIQARRAVDLWMAKESVER